VLDMMIHVALGLAAGAREPLAMNRGKPGGRHWPGESTAVAVAVARDLSGAGHRKIAGALAEATGGACAVTCPQACRRVAVLGLNDVAWHVRRRGMRGAGVGDARIMLAPDRHGTLRVTPGRGGSVMEIVVRGSQAALWSLPGHAAARRSGGRRIPRRLARCAPGAPRGRVLPGVPGHAGAWILARLPVQFPGAVPRGRGEARRS